MAAAASPVTHTRSEIRCDAHECPARIVIERDIDDAEAATIATDRGWHVKLGALRDYHHCPKHGDV